MVLGKGWVGCLFRTFFIYPHSLRNECVLKTHPGVVAIDEVLGFTLVAFVVTMGTLVVFVELLLVLFFATP